jgi:hypothetical protein
LAMEVEAVDRHRQAAEFHVYIWAGCQLLYPVVPCGEHLVAFGTKWSDAEWASNANRYRGKRPREV